MAGRYVGETAVGIAAAIRAGRASPTEVLEEHLGGSPPWTVGWGRSGCSGPTRPGPRRRRSRTGPTGPGCPWPGCRWRSRTTSTWPGRRPASGRPRATRSRRRPTTSWSAVSAGPGAAGRQDQCAGSDRLWPFTGSDAFGVARSPWSLDHTPGGSSGGSAARWPAARSRSPWVPTAPARSACRPPTAGWSASSPGTAWCRSRLRRVDLVTDERVQAAGHHRGRPRAGPGRAGGHRRLPGGGAARPAAADRGQRQAGRGRRQGVAGQAAMDATAEALAGAEHRVETVEPPWRHGDAAAILQRVFHGCAEDTDRLTLGGPGAPHRSEARVERAAAPGQPAPTSRRAGCWPATRPGSPSATRCSARPWPCRRCRSAPTAARAGRDAARRDRLHAVHPPINLVGFPAARSAPPTTGCPSGCSWPPPPAARPAAVAGPPAGDTPPLAPPRPAGAAGRPASALVGGGQDHHQEATHRARFRLACTLAGCADHGKLFSRQVAGGVGPGGRT